MATQPVDERFSAGQLLGHYRVKEKIGFGGMGDVYLAQDEHLDREVAVKVLSSRTRLDESSRKRFHKEGIILSKLHHPNIAAIHDLDTQQDSDFLVMEYVPGVSLRERIAGGPLSERDVIDLGIQLAEGLAAAHEHGVIHRDLKPGNLRVTSDNRLKILDFGLAQLKSPISDTATTDRTSSGQSLGGTLLYMAPEQLLGEELDARTDIHGAGAVLYEMATGRRPFAEAKLSRLIGAILRKAPEAPEKVNPKISPELQRVIEKCLQKEPGRRYQCAKELADDLRLIQPGVPIALPFFLRRRRWLSSKYTRFALAIAVAIAVLLFGVQLGNRRSHLLDRLLSHRIESLAVLPLANLSGDPQQEYLADSMTDALITDLAKLGGLRVISRTSVMQYKQSKKPLSEVARELSVDAIVEGSVLRSGDTVRITAQVIQVSGERQLLAENYEGDVHSILVLQKQAAEDISNRLRARVTPQQQMLLPIRLMKPSLMNGAGLAAAPE